MLKLNTSLNEKIVLFGMSCSGKTTFARELIDHFFYSFDLLFPWYEIETFGLSIKSCLKQISSSLKEERYVLDGWNLADKECSLIPEDAFVYVIYSEYENIINNYRVPITGPNGFFNMYENWYKISFKDAKYIKNEGSFRETSLEEFTDTVSRPRNLPKIWSRSEWTWV